MRVLIVGAGGFIGSHIVAALQRHGHDVVAAVRDRIGVSGRLSACTMVAADLLHLIDEGDWTEYLNGVSAVIYCAGLLQGPSDDLERVHNLAPRALFAACKRMDVHRVVLISAVSANMEAGTAYATSKCRGEDALRETNLDWIILRPSLVWSPCGSYGGTSALRGFAAFPFFIPVAGGGNQAFSPITVEELSAFTADLILPSAPSRVTMEPCGPQTLTFREMVSSFRLWLGLGKARFWQVPLPVVRLICRVGDVIGLGPVSSTALVQIEHGNTGDYQAFSALAGSEFVGFDETLSRHPASEQDLWHARLYFAEPALRIVLSLVWVVSGIVGFLAPPEFAADLFSPIGLPDLIVHLFVYSACLADIVLGLAILIGVRPVLMAKIQVALIAGYTIILSVVQPSLWSDPFGPLLKNLPVLACIGIHTILARRR